jgi:ketosteroid isomerase-like protein
MNGSAVTVVQAWHESLNAGDVERLVALSGDDVEVGGPRGSSRGASVLREWFGRAGIHLEPRRTFHRGDTVVVEHEAEWRDSHGNATSRQTVVSVFVVRDNRVARVTRYADLSAAFAASGMAEADAV